MNEKDPRQVLAKLSTDPAIESLEKLRTDRYVKQNFVAEPDKRFNTKRLVPVACATLGLLLIAPSATNVFAAGFDVPGEGLPVAPSQIETDQSPIQQPKKPKKDFRLVQKLKEVERKASHLVPSVPSVPAENNLPPSSLPTEDSEHDDQPVTNQPVNDQTPPQQSDQVVTTDKPHQSSPAVGDLKSSHPTLHHRSALHHVSQSQEKTNKSSQNVSDDEREASNQTTVVQSSKGAVAVETVSVNKSGNQKNIPATQDTPLPKTASSDPTKAAAGLGVALLGLAWKTRRYGKV